TFKNRRIQSQRPQPPLSLRMQLLYFFPCLKYPSILGPQPHLSTALLAQQPQHSPAFQPSQPSPIPQGKRTRTRISEEQVSILRKHFDINSLPKEEYDRLSALLSLPNRVIVVWFQNARQRARKNQDRGPDDGFEVKNNLNNTPRHKTLTLQRGSRLSCLQGQGRETELRKADICL
uniref:Homeobox domain-containing protein n=1 Tax=Oryzias sinensis TaxID=183150 RepID=A0A8C7Y7Q4_9TELE